MNAHVIPPSENITKQAPSTAKERLDREIGRAYDLTAMLNVCHNAIGIEGVNGRDEATMNRHLGHLNRLIELLANLSGSLVEQLEGIHMELDSSDEDTTSPDGDQLIQTIQAYEAGMRDYIENAARVFPDNESAYADQSYRPPMEQLDNWSTPAANRHSAIAALKLVLNESVEHGSSPLIAPMIDAVIGYLSRD